MDRFAVLLDLWAAEARFLEAKMKVTCVESAHSQAVMKMKVTCVESAHSQAVMKMKVMCVGSAHSQANIARPL